MHNYRKEIALANDKIAQVEIDENGCIEFILSDSFDDSIALSLQDMKDLINMYEDVDYYINNIPMESGNSYLPQSQARNKEPHVEILNESGLPARGGKGGVQMVNLYEDGIIIPK